MTTPVLTLNPILMHKYRIRSQLLLSDWSDEEVKNNTRSMQMNPLGNDKSASLNWRGLRLLPTLSDHQETPLALGNRSDVLEPIWCHRSSSVRSSILSQLLNTLINPLRTLPNVDRDQSLCLIFATCTLTSTLSRAPNFRDRSEVHTQTKLHLPHTANFTSSEVCLERRRTSALLILDIDASKTLLAAISDFVAFVDVDESGEADTEPLVSAHEVAFCDSFSILREDETSEFIDGQC